MVTLNKLLQQIEVDPREFIAPPQIGEATNEAFAEQLRRKLGESVPL